MAVSFSYLSNLIRDTLVHLEIAHEFKQSARGIYTLKSLLQKVSDQRPTRIHGVDEHY